jgi:hypothetical protein
MKKSILVFFLISFFFLIPALWGISIKDFDKIIDFSITLKELSTALETNTFDRIDKSKFVMLNGTVSTVRPSKNYFYLLQPEDIVNVPGFIKSLKKTSHKVSQYLVGKLSQDLRDQIASYNGPSDNDTKLIKNVCREFEKLFRGESIYNMERFAGISLDMTLKEYAQKILMDEEKVLKKVEGIFINREERAFVNRSLMEAAYPAFIRPITMQLELMYGVWIGYNEVKSYTSIIEFNGLECFKIFKRSKPSEGAPEMISMNATVLIVAKIVDIYELDNGEKGWLLEGFYIREVLK